MFSRGPKKQKFQRFDKKGKKYQKKRKQTEFVSFYVNRVIDSNEYFFPIN